MLSIIFYHFLVIGNQTTLFQSLFNYVGAFGSSSSKLADYVSVTFPSSAILSTESVRLLINYIPIGTELDPQYQITHAIIESTGIISTTEVYLFVEFEMITTGSSVFMNVPPPPTVQAPLPDDFLYPFYVA